MKVSVCSGTGEVHGSDMESAGIRVGGLASSVLWLVPSPKWEHCIHLHQLCAQSGTKLVPVPHQTNKHSHFLKKMIS